jgi:hypothetical protein
LKSDKTTKDGLANLPKSLDDIYNRILGRIKRDSNENLEEVIRLLRWIAISVTPLTVNELAQAIAVNIGDKQLDFSAIATDPMDISFWNTALDSHPTAASSITKAIQSPSTTDVLAIPWRSFCAQVPSKAYSSPQSLRTHVYPLPQESLLYPLTLA